MIYIIAIIIVIIEKFKLVRTYNNPDVIYTCHNEILSIQFCIYNNNHYRCSKYYSYMFVYPIATNVIQYRCSN